MKLFSSEGKEVECEKDQREILLAAGFTVEKVESKKVESENVEDKDSTGGGTGGEDEDKKAPVDDFQYKTEEQLEGMKVRERKEYEEALAAHKAKMTG